MYRATTCSTVSTIAYPQHQATSQHGPGPALPAHRSLYTLGVRMRLRGRLSVNEPYDFSGRLGLSHSKERHAMQQAEIHKHEAQAKGEQSADVLLGLSHSACSFQRADGTAASSFGARWR